MVKINKKQKANQNPQKTTGIWFIISNRIRLGKDLNIHRATVYNTKLISKNGRWYQ